MLTVHHLETSRSQRILWLLEELSLPYDIRRYARDPVTRLAPAELKQVHPLGKSPVITDGATVVAESGAIIEYVHALPGAPALLPADGYAAAKVRELDTYINLHLELVARNLYPQALFGGKISDEVRETTLPQLEKNVAAFARLARFTPFIAGDSFSIADCSAIVHLPLVSTATKLVYGKDVLAELPVRDYLARMGERAAVQKVSADRKANAAQMVERMKAGK